MTNKIEIICAEDEQYLKKVVVKTEDDLPKKDVIIYGKYKNSVMIEAIEFHKNDLQWGIANIDWYFLPVTKEELQGEICIYPRVIKEKYMTNKRKILVADDSSEVQEAVKTALEKNYELSIVSTPEEAINYNKKFDLLLTDFYFGKDKKRGLEVIKELKEKRKGLSAILMSSELNQNIKNKCEKLNIPTFPKYEDNITPIDADSLRELIKSYLK